RRSLSRIPSDRVRAPRDVVQSPLKSAGFIIWVCGQRAGKRGKELYTNMNRLETNGELQIMDSRAGYPARLSLLRRALDLPPGFFRSRRRCDSPRPLGFVIRLLNQI